MFLDIGFLIQWWITVRWMSNFIEHQFYVGKGWRHGLGNPNLEGLHLMVPITHVVSSIINIHIYGAIRESFVFTLILPIRSKTCKMDGCLIPILYFFSHSLGSYNHLIKVKIWPYEINPEWTLLSDHPPCMQVGWNGVHNIWFVLMHDCRERVGSCGKQGSCHWVYSPSITWRWLWTVIGMYLDLVMILEWGGIRSTEQQ